MEDVIISSVASSRDVAVVQQLWREYWDSIGLPMDFQGFSDELRGLPGVYGKEGAALLLATFKDQAAGTIALRRLDLVSGEVKRLYLRPQFRGFGLGRRLLEAVIGCAAESQYLCLYADTMPNMTEALTLYKRSGFEEVNAYSNTPTPGAIYLKLQLVKDSNRVTSGSL